MQRWITIQQQLAVPATAERGIHKQTALPVITGVLSQRLQKRFCQNWHMGEGLIGPERLIGHGSFLRSCHQRCSSAP